MMSLRPGKVVVGEAAPGKDDLNVIVGEITTQSQPCFLIPTCKSIEVKHCFVVEQ